MSTEPPTPAERLAAFMKSAREYAVARPCVGSGFCCKEAPCPYGSRDPATGWCIHLEPWKDDTLDVPRYRCGRYEFIQTQPGSEWVPAFGAGCCMPLFNDDRDRIVRALRVVRDP